MLKPLITGPVLHTSKAPLTFKERDNDNIKMTPQMWRHFE